MTLELTEVEKKVILAYEKANRAFYDEMMRPNYSAGRSDYARNQIMQSARKVEAQRLEKEYNEILREKPSAVYNFLISEYEREVELLKGAGNRPVITVDEFEHDTDLGRDRMEDYLNADLGGMAVLFTAFLVAVLVCYVFYRAYFG